MMRPIYNLPIVCQGEQRCAGVDFSPQELWVRGWRDDLVIKSQYCCHRGTEFGFQHPHQVVHNSSSHQVSITLAPGDPMPSFGLHGYTQMHPHK